MTVPDPLADLAVEPADDSIPAGAAGDDPSLWAALLAEHRAERLGRLWYAEIRSACASKARRYPPGPYARAADWDEAAIDDLAMDAVERLLRKGQIEYICDVADGAGHARALLHRQVRFALLERRERTVVDNLLDRAVEVLRGPGYREEPGPPPSWSAAEAGRPPPAAAADTPQGRLLALRLRRLPRMPAAGAERASPVWSLPTLERAVDDAVRTLGAVTHDSLGAVLRDGLTSLVPSELVSDEAGIGRRDPAAGPEEEAVARQSAERALGALTAREAHVLACKLDGLSDADTAAEIGVSRPTVDGAKSAGTAKVRDALAGLGEAAQNEALVVLYGLLSDARARSNA